MDRNLLWDRTEKAYSNLTDPDIQITNISPKDYIEKSYAKNITCLLYTSDAADD